MFSLDTPPIMLSSIPPLTWIPVGSLGISYNLSAIFPTIYIDDLGAEYLPAASVLRDPQILSGGKMRVIGPSDVVGDPTQYGRATAAELMSYQNLGAGWDGGVAASPSTRAIGNALRMLEITPRGVEAPKPMLLATGEVALYWDFGEIYAEIGFDDTGVYYAFATRPEFDPVHLDDVAFDDEGANPEFPSAVREILTWAPLKAAA